MTSVGDRIAVLMFHAVGEDASPLAFDAAVMRHMFQSLRDRGYRTVGLTSVADRLHSSSDLPSCAFVVTFDDGYRSVYEQALPILLDFGMTATVFVTVGESPVTAAEQRMPSLEERPMLSWGELRDWVQAGMSVGAHTLTHPDLTAIAASRVESEMRDSKARLEDGLGIAIDSFAYPFGRFDATSRRLAREHFSCACSDRLGLVGAASDPWALERVETYYLSRPALAPLAASPWLAPYLRLRSLPRSVRRLFARRRRASAARESR